MSKCGCDSVSHPLAGFGTDCPCTQTSPEGALGGVDSPLEKTLAVATLIATVLGIFVNIRLLSKK